MKLSEIKSILRQSTTLSFALPDGTLVPSHFHVTEVGQISKKFIDCGGVVRQEEVANFQLWNANDYDHRLHPEKLLNIIQLAEEKLGMTDCEIEVEYQLSDQLTPTIGKFGLDFQGNQFVLTTKLTACLAQDQCGIPMEKPKVKLASLTSNSCTPGGGCC